MYLRVILSSIALFWSAAAHAHAGMCGASLRAVDIPVHFTKLALKQLALEYGPQDLILSRLQSSPAGRDLVRVEAYLKYPAPNQEGLSTAWIVGWLSRCDGTLVMRGNTWLADGTLAVPRFTRQQLPGKGVVMGKPSAPLHLIAFVDSRCPHCHRLIAYARELLKKNAIYIEFRQVAYLESVAEAVRDARIFDTGLVLKEPRMSSEEYLGLLGDLNSAMDIDQNQPEYRQGVNLVQTNTNTARDVLHVTTVPAVLVLDQPASGAFRLAGLLEMNRLFQPDL